MPTLEQDKRMKELQADLARVKKEAPPKKVTPEEVEKLLADLEKETNGGWRVIYPKTVMSDAGAKLDVLEDRTVLAGGKATGSDTYTIHGVAPETGTITAVRLEALTHDSLPMRGPGRSSGGNFVLSQFTFETDGVPHKFRKAIADYSQGDFPVNDVVKNDTIKGWGISGGVGRDHQAVFYLDKAHPVREGQAFVFTLRHSQKFSGYALGRFRIAVTFASDRFLGLPLEAQNVVLIDSKKRTAKEMEIARQALLKAPPPSERVVKLQKEIKALEGQIDSTLVLRESAKTRVTRIQLRGDFLTLGDEVQPDVFAVLNPLGVKERPANRLDLARWLVSPDNPLTARVFMNRMWQQYFGKGIVETENDFGIQGALPTHPELLDWLALEFSLPSPLEGRGERCLVDQAHAQAHRHQRDISPGVEASARSARKGSAEQASRPAASFAPGRRDHSRLGADGERLADAQDRRARGLSAAAAGDFCLHAEQPSLAREQRPGPLSPRHVHVYLEAKPASAPCDV